MKKISLILLLVAVISCKIDNPKEDISTSTLTPVTEASTENVSTETDDLMGERELSIALTGSGYKKAELLFGYYDDLSSSSSSYITCVLYRNKARSLQGEVANIVLVVRFIDMFDWNTATITKVYVLPEGGKCHCGLTPMKIKDGKLY